MRYQAIVVGLVLAATGTGLALANDIYKWTDEAGNVHYADIPSGDFPERVDIESRPTDPDRVQAMMRAMNDRRIKAAATKAAAASELPTDEEVRATAAERAEKCTAYKANLETYLVNRRLYNEGPGGERDYLDNDEITAARELAAKRVTEYCS
jgi:hypothetical protein